MDTIICLMLFGVIPLFGLAYVSGKKGLTAGSGETAYPYGYS